MPDHPYPDLVWPATGIDAAYFSGVALVEMHGGACPAIEAIWVRLNVRLLRSTEIG